MNSFKLFIGSKAKQCQFIQENPTTEIGFIAQDYEGVLSLRYNDFIPILTQANSRAARADRYIKRRNGRTKKLIKQLI